jgi:hypothetical protein
MENRRSPIRFFLVLALGLALSGVLGLSPPAQASTEDAAIFYEELAQHGNWVDDAKHGPVWYPKGVEEGWRPYLNGRWNPTQQGYVFETQEPWGWATYHYGNWMPTQSHGWVWAPGRTWYPNTVNWRTSDDYVGWAPIPPPNFTPPPSYAMPGGSGPGLGAMDLLTAPFYIFAKAASFLLGFGQSYSPAYSYMDSGILAPPSYAPVVYSRTVIVNNYVVPNYYPAGHLARGSCAYAWGPPVKYVSRVTRINQALINNHIRRMSLTRIHHGLPGDAILSRRPFLRQIVPGHLVEGKPLPRVQTVPNVGLAMANLARPNVVPALKEVPRLTASIPKAQAGKWEPGQGIPGASLPPKAVQPLTPGMTKQIEKLPPQKRIVSWPGPQPGVAGDNGQVAPAGKQADPRGKPEAPAARPGAPPTPPMVQGAAPEPKPVPPRVATRDPGKTKPELSQEQRERQPRRQEMQPRPQEQQPQRQAQWQWQQRQQEMQQQRQQEMQQRQAQWQQQQAQRQQEMQQRRQQELQQRQQQWQQRQQEMAQRRQQEMQQRQQQHQQRQQQIQQQRQERQQQQQKEKKKQQEQQQQQQQSRLYR